MQTSAEKLHQLIKIMFFIASGIIIVLGINVISEAIKVYSNSRYRYSTFTVFGIKTQSILIYIFVIILALAFLVFVLYLISLFLCAIMEFFIDVHRYTTRKSMNEDIPTRSTMPNRPTPGQGRPPIQNNRPDPSRPQQSI